MIRVLVAGGAGVFGSRLVEGLAAAGIVVAGRSAGRAEAVAARTRRAFPGAAVATAILDVGTVTAATLSATVDAEGRFRFDVPISLPMIGQIVRYRGRLVAEA